MIRLLRLLIAGLVVRQLFAFLRGRDRRTPARRPDLPTGRQTREDGRAGDDEPVLGYDGMDIQTVVPWLESANLDRPTLRRVREYENQHQARETVLRTIDRLLD